MIADLVFRIWGADFHRKFAENGMRGSGREGLIPAFHGPDGKGYYTWKDTADIPPVRLKRIEEILIWIDAKTTRPTLEKLAEDINKQLLVVLRKKKEEERSAEAAKISVLMTEVLLRASHVIPEELYYQIVSICLVREDEDGRKLDESTHEAKIAMLRTAGGAGATFFTRVAPFRQLLGAWLTSEQGFKELLINWTMEKERLRMVATVLGSESGSKSTGGSSTISPSESQGTQSKVTTD